MYYYKFNIADWAKATSHLTLKEEAIYLRLINFYYDHEKPIPLKTQLVLRKLRMGDESDTVEIILDEFFTKTAKGWIHNHCKELIEEYQERAEKNRKNGKKGGRPKINNLAKANGNQEESNSQPTGNLNQEPLTTNQEPLTKNQEIILEDTPTTTSEKKESLDYGKVKTIFNNTMTRSSGIVKMTDKRKRLVKKLFTDNDMNYERFENYINYINSHPDADWMFKKTPKSDGSGFWSPRDFDYFVSEKCYVYTKEKLL